MLGRSGTGTAGSAAYAVQTKDVLPASARHTETTRSGGCSPSSGSRSSRATSRRSGTVAPATSAGCRDGDDRAPGDRDDLAVAQHLEPEPALGRQLLAVPRGARHRHRREGRQVGDGDPGARAAGDLDRRRVVEEDDVELDGLADLQDQRRAGDQAAVLAGLEAEGDLERLVDHHHVGALGPGDVEAGVGLAGRLAVAEDGRRQRRLRRRRLPGGSAIVISGAPHQRYGGPAAELGAHGGDLGEHLAEGGIGADLVERRAQPQRRRQRHRPDERATAAVVDGQRARQRSAGRRAGSGAVAWS